MNAADIRFYFLDRSLSIKNRNKLKSFIKRKISLDKKNAGKIYFFFCSDRYLLRINKEFLKHDYYTDIITFNWNENNVINGEVYISVDRIRNNSKVFGETLKKESHRVIFHGVLHLLGISDKSRADKEQMTSFENGWLKNYFK
jgi:rRNA maturation RNase YbeY